MLKPEAQQKIDQELSKLKQALVDAKRSQFQYTGRISHEDMKVVIRSLEKQIHLLSNYTQEQ